MNLRNLIGISLMGMLLINCQEETVSGQNTGSKNNQEIIFPKGDKIANNNFVGSAWLTMLINADSLNQNSVGSVTFEPGARTNWHSHPIGQIILALDGEGYYQEKGSAKRIIKKGDAIKCPPNTPHWHGASPSSQFIQIAITSRQGGATQWLNAVTDEEYNSVD
ncbi:cupin domain-containing protein [Chondrinema litorale]|uniref:cupin domain-containing protein n=1 Tax=Chondrinema litorale TaxID=2994555 RepID=UPI002542C715|nr:cupin domain-containing protein [Chondrinema litorale]UZR98979.1 cupin domain-containing protein [Chondrinema litorale]